MTSEDWLMANGYMQAEGVAHLDQVPETGPLVAIGFPAAERRHRRLAELTAIYPRIGHGTTRWGAGRRCPNEAPGVERGEGVCASIAAAWLNQGPEKKAEVSTDQRQRWGKSWRPNRSGA
ncbi:hypothetical protein [Candidatus Skiveiella danica]|uniref:hypothetical protein n=1 Tax=Candidatus Skiveiella danica TaxID=3386177 RepID=UPI001D856C3F|nr:hypothetical protein [Betaproteobacteria bacterium]